MNLEVAGTNKVLLVEESQGLSLYTENQRFAVAIAGVPAMGPKGDTGEQGPQGIQGPQGPTGDVSKDDFYTSLAANPDQLIFGTIDRDSDGVITTAEVIWPDGTSGTFTVEEKNSTFLTIDSYTITYEPIGEDVVTYTQGHIDRDTNGAVIERPEIGVTS